MVYTSNSSKHLNQTRSNCLLTISLDSNSLIQTKINLSSIIQPDSYEKPKQVSPTTSLYDGSQVSKGTFLITSTSSGANYSQQKLVALSYQSPASQCILNTSNVYLSCGPSPTAQLTIQNLSSKYSFMINALNRIGSAVSCSLKNDSTSESVKTSSFILNYSQIHSYLGGCQIRIKIDTSLIYDLEFSILNSLNSKRRLSTALGVISSKQFNLFKLKQFNYSDQNKLCIRQNDKTFNPLIEIAFCSCKVCLSILYQVTAYIQFGDNSRCRKNFGDLCLCYDVSNITRASSSLTSITLNKVKLCTQCAFDSQCLGAPCQTLQSQIKIGNPLKPSITNIGFLNYNLDNGRVTDGKLKGYYCNCNSSLITSVAQAYKSTGNTYESYKIYDINSLTPQQLRQCEACLAYKTLSTSSTCQPPCKTFKIIYPITRPSGPFCATCMASSERFQRLSQSQQRQIQLCIKKSIKQNQNPLLSIQKTCNISSQLKNYLSSIFSGLLSHFLVECPSRTGESICMPYFSYNSFAPAQASLKAGTAYWSQKYQCLKPDCSLDSKSNCSGLNCVCYDSCPLGRAWFGYNYSIDKDNWVNIPCSGRGICKAGGNCSCFDGYIGNNCEQHCSLKGVEGLCCRSDEDCKMVESVSGLRCLEVSRSGIGYCGK